MAECDAEDDEFLKPVSRMGLSRCTGTPGEVDAARTAADVSLEAASGMGEEYFLGVGYAAAATAALAGGDVNAAHDASERARQHLSVAQPEMAAAQGAFNAAEAALAGGDIVAGPSFG